MKRPIVFAWLQVAAAAAIVLLMSYSVITRPTLQFDYSRQTGMVTSVIPGGTADRAGLRAGDRVTFINGERVRRGANPLFFVRAGNGLPVEIVRNGAEQTIVVRAVPFERSRRDALHAGIGRALWAIESYLIFPLNVWMLGLGIALLVLRPRHQDARLSAISLIAWAGGNFLGDVTGMGALLAPLPVPLRVALYAVDAAFLALFFAACLHFSIVFVGDEARGRLARQPSGVSPDGTPPRLETSRGLRAGRPRAIWHVVPYLLALPIFIETFGVALRRLDPATPPEQRLGSDDIYLTLGPLILVVALVVLAVRFLRMQDLNSRRRLKLIFIALLPGVLGFVISVIISRLELGYAWTEAGNILNKIGTIAGSGIYAYAVVRHRMYNIRVLVRRSIQYAFARGTLIAAMLLPAVGFLAFLWAHRNQSISMLLTGTPAVYLLVILPLILVVQYRRRLLEALDRRFFREQYDARQLLLHVVSMVRDGSDIFGLSRVALDEIERALHPKHISLWQFSAETQELRREFARGGSLAAAPLPAGSALATLLSTDDEPLDLFNRHTRTLVRRLPEGERAWLRENDAHLLVPLVIESRLAGIMLLGERMSEEPYSREDRELLRTLGAQLALTFDYSRLKASPSLVWSSQASHAGTPAPLVDELRTCLVCGRCFSSEHVKCDADEQMLVTENGVPRTIEDKYVVTRILGRGGMGSVYLAMQKRLNRPVAIKVLLGHLVGSNSMRGRFEREARIVARLRHPAIVTIHDFGLLPSNHAYLVMEYLEGNTLRKTMNGGPLPFEQAMELLRPIGDAVDTAHRAGIVHRDLKPENIMIVPDRDRGTMTPRVLDFGLAKMSGPIGDDEATLVQSGQSVGVVGTLMYIAPELLHGIEADPRSDQYSLALIAWELLRGEHPFGSATDLATVVRQQTETVPPPLEEPVPRRAADAIQRALQKDPAMRFASVGEFFGEMGRVDG